jgi:hypothetical protein
VSELFHRELEDEQVQARLLDHLGRHRGHELRYFDLISAVAKELRQFAPNLSLNQLKKLVLAVLWPLVRDGRVVRNSRRRTYRLSEAKVLL